MQNIKKNYKKDENVRENQEENNEYDYGNGNRKMIEFADSVYNKKEGLIHETMAVAFENELQEISKEITKEDHVKK